MATAFTLASNRHLTMKLALLSLLALTSAAAVTGRPANLTVQLPQGSYTGLIDPKYPNTRQYRAVPFAEPPVLGRRWMPPKRLSPSPEKHHYATRYPPSCGHFVTSVISLFDLPLSKGNLIYNGNQNDSSGLVGEATSEDCLYLAIWTPTRLPTPPSKGLPVLFFITGGGFILGGVDIPWQIPDSWVERTQSHIVVTINHRMDILGFPRARGLADSEQNLAMLDQRAALEWVRDHIAAFGGDPDRITLWGQSAGSIAADIHSYAWPDDPIVQGFWFQSGLIFNGVDRQDPTHSNFTFVASRFGCDFPGLDDGGAAELDCMRQVPFAQIINFVGQYADAGTSPPMRFNMVIDEKVIFADYEARAAAGKFARRPAILSMTANEMSSLVPWPAANLTEGPWQPAVTKGTVEGLVCPSLNMTTYRSDAGLPTYRIQYAGTFPNLNRYKWLGAYHASDIPIAFGTYHCLDGVAPSTDLEAAVSKVLQDHILAFAEDPWHGPQKMEWMPMNGSSPRGGDLLRIGAGGIVAQHIDGDEVDGVCLGIGEYDPFP